MKLSAAEIKTCRVAYLHRDGSLVIWHEKNHKDAGKIEWVTVWENIGINVVMDKGRRLIISKGVLPFIKHATEIRVHGPSFKGGSDKTREIGLQVETIELRNGCTHDAWFVSNFPGVISSDIYSHDSDDTFETIKTAGHWGDLRISKVHTEKPA